MKTVLKVLILSFFANMEILKNIKFHWKDPSSSIYHKKRKIYAFDNNDYQTVFAEKEGAVASPTASLHFTKNLINNLRKKKELN